MLRNFQSLHFLQISTAVPEAAVLQSHSEIHPDDETPLDDWKRDIARVCFLYILKFFKALFVADLMSRLICFLR